MTGPADLPGELTAGGLTWQRYVYNDKTRYKWYRPMTDDEVQNHSRGRWSGLDDVDAELASPPDYPRVEVELVDNSDGCYRVTASRTRLSTSSDVLMTEPLGGEFTIEADDRESAIAAVRRFVQDLS